MSKKSNGSKHSPPYCLTSETTIKRPAPHYQDIKKLNKPKKLIHLNQLCDRCDEQNTMSSTKESRKLDNPQQSSTQQPEKQPTPTKKIEKRTLTTIHQTLRQKFANLLPESIQVKYAPHHEILLQVQTKIDEHVEFLRIYRGAKRGQFFNKVRQAMLEARLEIKLTYLKQINFLIPNFYRWTFQKDQRNKQELFLNFHSEVRPAIVRRDELREALYKYLNSNHGFQEKVFKRMSKQSLQIPQKDFDCQNEFRKMIEQKEKQLCILKQKKEEQLSSESQEQINPLDILHKQKSLDFKAKLLKIIKARQQKLKEKEQKQKAIQMVDGIKIYPKKVMLNVLDEIQLCYMSKNISNMFKSTLLTDLDKKLSKTITLTIEDIMNQIITILIKQQQATKQKCYLKLLDHKQGTIIQVDKRLFANAQTIIMEWCEKNDKSQMTQ